MTLTATLNGQPLPAGALVVSGDVTFKATLSASTTPVPTPTPTPTPVPDPVIVKTAGVKPVTNWDGGGKTFKHDNPAPWTSLIQSGADGIEIADATLWTPVGPTTALLLDRNNVIAEDLTFAADNGFCIKASGSNITIRRVKATTFADYFVYAEKAKNLTIEDCEVAGGSTRESILRIDGAENFTVLRCRFDYTTNPRKACFRGSGTGKVIDSVFKGAIVGVNPLSGGDGGQLYGIAKFLTTSIVTAPDIAACTKAVRAAIALGEKDQGKLCRIGAAAAGIAITDEQVKATVARRASDLANYSVVEFQNTTCDFGIRWDAGTKYVYRNGQVIGDPVDGTIFHRPTSVYPEPDYLLPGDKPRSAPDIAFIGTVFTSHKLTIDQFRQQVKDLGVKLTACGFNGIAL